MMAKNIILITLLLAGLCFGLMTVKVNVPNNSTNTTNTSNHDGWEAQTFSSYATAYVSSTGEVISNHQVVSWCPNSCIGCGDDVTSEGVARLADYAAKSDQKAILDLELGYYQQTMKNNATGLMMWKLNNDGTAGSCGGENAATDADLYFIGSMLTAYGRYGEQKYLDTANTISAALKSGLVQGKYLPDCMYPQGSTPVACTRRVYLGYVNLKVLRQICETLDNNYCIPYVVQKEIMKGALKDNGVYSSYDINTATYSYVEAPIHPSWVLKHLVVDGSIDSWEAAKPYYDQSRSHFMADQSLCQEFQPFNGCLRNKPSIFIYADYLEMASAKGDIAFRDGLLSYIKSHNTLWEDNFKNIVVLQSVAAARLSGADTK